MKAMIKIGDTRFRPDEVVAYTAWGCETKYQSEEEYYEIYLYTRMLDDSGVSTGWRAAGAINQLSSFAIPCKSEEHQEELMGKLDEIFNAVEL